ncbi:unnamed protein product, partial [Rotaria sordida]
MCSVPVVIIANKSDLPTAVKPSELIEQLNLHSISRPSIKIRDGFSVPNEARTSY